MAKKQLYECEFSALYCAFLLWGQRVSSAAVIYTDNAVRDTLISAARTTQLSGRSWWPRLPLNVRWYRGSHTNSSDAPSRLSCQALLDAGVTKMDVDVIDCWQRLQVLQAKWGEAGSTCSPCLKRKQLEQSSVVHLASCDVSS